VLEFMKLCSKLLIHEGKKEIIKPEKQNETA